MSWGLPTRIESYSDAQVFWRRLKDDVEFPCFYPYAVAHFRGEAEPMNELKPKIARYGRSLADMKKIEAVLLKDFKQELTANGLLHNMEDAFIPAYAHHSEWLFIQQAQHLGLATRFLDWTLKYQVALFFACEKAPSTEGKLYVLFPDHKMFQADRQEDQYAKTEPLAYNETVFLNPTGLASKDKPLKVAERFRMRQHGRFFVQPLPDCRRDLSPILTAQNVLHTVIISASAKKDILAKIADDGAARDWLFMHDDARSVQFVQTVTPMIEGLHKKHLY